VIHPDDYFNPALFSKVRSTGVLAMSNTQSKPRNWVGAAGTVPSQLSAQTPAKPVGKLRMK